MALNYGKDKVCGFWASPGAIHQFELHIHRCARTKLRDVAWQRKVDPILDNLTLDRLVLNLSDSFCDGTGCECRMAAMAIMCFEKGFALQPPKAVVVKGWNAGRPDIDAVVRDCLGV